MTDQRSFMTLCDDRFTQNQRNNGDDELDRKTDKLIDDLMENGWYQDEGRQGQMTH